jgi:transposase
LSRCLFVLPEDAGMGAGAGEGCEGRFRTEPAVVRVRGEDDRRGHRAHPVDVQDSRGHELDMLGQGPLVVLQFRAEGDDGGGEAPAYEASLETAELTLDRRNRPGSKITAMAATERYAPVVRALMCLRGISVLTAVGLAVEIGDWNRFSGNTIGAYLGLVPSEHSPGASRSQGSITKTGNTHARRLLIEAAWHHRRPYNNASRDMRSRWDLCFVNFK